MKKSNNAHFISAFDVLNKDDYISGVKLDNEFLRSHFRERATDNV